MRRLAVVLAALVCVLAPASSIALAGNSALNRPVVTVESSVINVNSPLKVRAARFCANQSIKFTISGPSGTWTTRAVNVGADGKATYTIPASKTKKAGTYTITAKQRPVDGHGCFRTAATTVKVKKTTCTPHTSSFERHRSNGCYYGYPHGPSGASSLGTYTGSAIVAAFSNLQAGMDARSATARVSAAARSVSSAVEAPSSTSHGTRPAQMGAVALTCIVGIAGVETARRRARRPVTA